MKTKKKKQGAFTSLSSRNFANDFVRGTLTSGIVSAVAREDRIGLDRRTVRTALQGGMALAAITVAADALQQRRFFQALLATAGAAAGVYALQQLLPDAGELS